MSTHRIAVIASLLAAVAIAGCAHKPPASPSASPQANAAASSLNPTAPDGIVALGKRFTTDRRAIYSAILDRYTYFAGGVLSAEYGASTEILKIASLEPGKADLVCTYSPQGVLYVDPKTRPDNEAFTASCNRLALLLNDHLSQ